MRSILSNSPLNQRFLHKFSPQRLPNPVRAQLSTPPILPRHAFAALATMASPDNVKIALCQILAGSDKQANLATAVAAVDDAARQGAQLISLPECFNSPYATDQFPVYAEPIPASKAELDSAVHPSTAALSAAAARNQVYLIGGSIPERGPDGKVYNTCVAFDPTGEIVAVHRKIHLFDIDVPGRITFKESDTLTGGDRLAVFDTPYGKVGLGICYDIRFPYLAMLLRQAGAKFLFYPGAFNMTTGPAHWELLLRSRALDTQCYAAAVSIARNPESKYQAWGHSTLVSPWGEVLGTTDEKASTVIAEVPIARVDEIRAQIPVSFQVRHDLYALTWHGPGAKQ